MTVVVKWSTVSNGPTTSGSLGFNGDKLVPIKSILDMGWKDDLCLAQWLKTLTPMYGDKLDVSPLWDCSKKYLLLCKNGDNTPPIDDFAPQPPANKSVLKSWVIAEYIVSSVHVRLYATGDTSFHFKGHRLGGKCVKNHGAWCIYMNAETHAKFTAYSKSKHFSLKEYKVAEKAVCEVYDLYNQMYVRTVESSS